MWAFLTIVVFLILSAICALLAYTFREDFKKLRDAFSTEYASKITLLQAEKADKLKELAEYEQNFAEKKIKLAELRHQLSITRVTSKLMQARSGYRRAIITGIQDMTNNIAKARDELVEYYTDKRQEETDVHRTIMEDLSNKASLLDQKKNNLENDLLKKEKQFREDMAMLETRLAQLEQDIQNTQEQKGSVVWEERPDGRVILVNSQFNFVIINAGSKDGIKNGQRFKVFQYDSNRIPIEKGFIICRVLGERISYAQIVLNIDPINPILEGDIISSPIFGRGKVVTIAVIGKIRGYTSIDPELNKALRKKLARDIQEYGAVFSEEVTPNCDLVVVSALVAEEDEESIGEEELEQLRLTKEFDIHILHEKEFLRYIAN